MMLLATVDIDMGEAAGQHRRLSIGEREDIMAMRGGGPLRGRGGQGARPQQVYGLPRAAPQLLCGRAERGARCVRRKRLLLMPTKNWSA